MKRDPFFEQEDAFDPLWQFDPALHFRPRVYKSDFFRLTGYWLIDVLFPKTPELMQQWSNKLTWALRLSYGQKAMWYWATLDGQVSNGGFVQFYYNGYGWYIPTILKGLAHIGEKKVADFIRKAHELYLADKDIINEGMQGDLFGSNLYDQMDELSSLDHEYYKISCSVFDVLDPYVRAHPNEFCVDEDGNEIDPLLTGDFQCHYPDGTIRDAFSIDRGQLVGHFKQYYPNGLLKEDYLYEAGSFTGEKEVFYETGMLKYNTKRVGYKDWIRRELFFANGMLQRIEHRTKDITNLPRQFVSYTRLYEEGVLIGEFREWYQNGQLRMICNHLGDYKHRGKYLKYHADGTIEFEIEYHDAGEEVSRYEKRWPKTERLIRTCLRAYHLDQVKEAARKLYYNEFDHQEFREQLIGRLEKMDPASLSEKEKERLRIIIRETELTNPDTNRNIEGNYLWVFNWDAAFFQTLAERAKAILGRLLF